MGEIMGIAPAQEEMSPKSLEWMQALFSEDELGQECCLSRCHQA